MSKKKNIFNQNKEETNETLIKESLTETIDELNLNDLKNLADDESVVEVEKVRTLADLTQNEYRHFQRTGQMPK